jgi:hypothetical protein
LRAKFRELAGVVLTEEGAGTVEQAIDRIEEWVSVGTLTGLVQHYGHA